jgi:hypothetical protein
MNRIPALAAASLALLSTMKSYPGLCHLFTPAGNPPSPADYDTPGRVSGGMVNEIASWVDAQHGELR